MVKTTNYKICKLTCTRGTIRLATFLLSRRLNLVYNRLRIDATAVEVAFVC